MSDIDEKKVKSRSALVNAGSTVVLVALFAIAALVLLSTGMQVYKNVVLAANENFELRTSLSYVAAKIRQADAYDAVEVRDFDGIRALVLTEEIDGDLYDTMIYHKDGALCELLQLRGLEPEFDFGFETMEIDCFTIEKNGPAIVLTAQNGAGESDSITVRLRSE